MRPGNLAACYWVKRDNGGHAIVAGFGPFERCINIRAIHSYMGDWTFALLQLLGLGS